MTSMQLDLLEFIYDDQKSIRDIYEALSLDNRTLNALTKGMGQYFYVQRKELFENSLLSINNLGKEAVEARRSATNEKHTVSVRYWVTTGVAILALILAILSLVLQWTR